MENVSRQTPVQSQAKSRGFKVALYLGLVLLSYFVFLIWFFPYDLLAKGILSKTQDFLPVPVSVTEVRPSFPAAVRFVDVKIGPVSSEDARIFKIDEIKARAGLLKALMKRIDAGLKTKLYGGTISLDFKGTDVAGDADLVIAELDLGQIMAAMSPESQTGVSGRIGGKGKFHIDRLSVGQNSGTAAIKFDDIKLKNVSLMVLKTDFEFEDTEAQLELAKGGVLEVKSANFKGKPCGFDITGTISVNYKNPGESRLDLQVVLHPTPEFEAKLPLAMLKKNEKGFYTGKLRGTFIAPKFQ